MATVLHNQNIFDIATELCGTALATFEFAIANKISITDDLTAGQNLIEVKSIFKSEKIVDFFKSKNQKIATAISIEQIEQIENIGIGTMTIGTNFIVN